MRSLIIILLSILLFPDSFAQVNAVRTTNFFEAINNLGNAPTHCEVKAGSRQIFSRAKNFRDIKIDIKPKGLGSYEGLDVSILSKEDAERLYEVFKELDYIPTKYLEDGCYARAHELALISKNNDIQLGKAFLVPKNGRPLLYPKGIKDIEDSGLNGRFQGWKYHTNAFVLVINEDRKVKPYVFDIGVSDKIQNFEEWKSGLTKKAEDAKIIVKPAAIIFHDRKFTSSDTSIIDDLNETQKLINKVGMNEYLFRRENSGF